MARKKNLALVGGTKKQMQSEKAHSWTGDKEREFLSILSETCNVTRACEVVGMSTAGAYKHRRKNAVFRAAWAETMSTAYQQLELVLLDRTFNGTEKVIQRHDGTEDRMREYPNHLGLRLAIIYLRKQMSDGRNQGGYEPDEAIASSLCLTPTRKMCRAGAEVLEASGAFQPAEALASMVYTAMREAEERSA